MESLFSALHKKKPHAFGNVRERREEGSKIIKNLRHVRRTERFNERRNIEPEEIRPVASKAKQDQTSNDRKRELKEFLARKECVKKAQSKNKRPPFVVGIPHHGSSPILKEITNVPHEFKLKKNHRPTNLKEHPEVRNQRVTRFSTRTAQGSFKKPNEKSFFDAEKSKTTKLNLQNSKKGVSSVKAFPIKQKTVFTFRGATVTSSKQLTSPHTPTVLKRSAQKMIGIKTITSPHQNVLGLLKKKTERALKPPVTRALLKQAIEEKKLNCSQSVESVESLASTLLGSENSLLSDEPFEQKSFVEIEPGDMNNTAELYNPDNASESSDNRDEFIPNPNSSLSETPVCSSTSEAAVPDQSESKESSIQRKRLEEETVRLLALADEWETIALGYDIPQEIKDEVDSVVGQTKLLTRDKFNQFRGLIDQFENVSNSKKITTDDLHGFWDMMYLQVESLTKKYDDLKIQKQNEWTKPEAVRKRSIKSRAKTTIKVVSKAPSAFREMIRARRAESSTTSDAVEEIDIKTPGSKSVMSRVLSSSRRVRRSTPSPYIAMRLSSLSRNLSITNVPIDLSHLNATSEANTTPKARMSNSSENKSLSFLCTSASLEETNTRDSLKTPRRSMRLKEKKSQTPLQKRCQFCDSPDCQSCNQSAECSPSKHQVSRKRFQLRPSILVVPKEMNNTTMIPKTNIPKKRLKTTKDEIHHEALEGNTFNLRRSTRAHKVTFDTSMDDKINIKLPSTPFITDKKKSIETPKT